MMKNAFFHVKNYFRSWDIYIFSSDFLVMSNNRLNKKVKVNFKIQGVTDWTTNNYNTHIDWYLINYWQRDNEIWLVNRM